MSWLQKLLAGMAVLGLAAFAGCGGGGKDKDTAKKDAPAKDAKDGKKDGAKDGAGGGASARTDLKSGDLKGPDGVMITDIKMPKSAAAAHYWNTAKLGDWAEYEIAGNVSRKEIVALAAEGLVEISVMKVAGMEIKSGMKVLFSEPDAAPVKDAKAPEIKKGTDKVKVGDKDVDCETMEMETEAAGMKFKTKTWMSKDVPCGGLVKSETNGMVSMMLKGFGRGK